jgi:hypothetical protein
MYTAVTKGAVASIRQVYKRWLLAINMQQGMVDMLTPSPDTAAKYMQL